MCVEPADDAALREQLPHDRIVGGELAGLLGDRLGLREPLGVDEGVVFFDEHRQPLVNLDLLRFLTGDAGLDLGALPLHLELSAAFAGRFLDVAAGPFDPLLELRTHLFGNCRVGNLGGGFVEQGERVGGGTLGGPPRLELLGGDFGRNPRHEQVIWNDGGAAIGRSTACVRAGIFPRPGDRLFHDPTSGGGLVGGRRQFLGGRLRCLKAMHPAQTECQTEHGHDGPADCSRQRA